MLPRQITFRRLQRSDLPLMLRWVNAPHVRRWYATERTLAGLKQKYGPRIDRRDPTDPYLILLDGRPAGYLQTYRIADYPEYARQLGADETAAGVDLFIGEVDLTHQGLGCAALRRFLAEVVFSDAVVATCVLGPDPENAAAIRCSEKAGFRFWKQVTVPGEPAPESLMRLSRSEFAPDGR